MMRTASFVCVAVGLVLAALGAAGKPRAPEGRAPVTAAAAGGGVPGSALAAPAETAPAPAARRAVAWGTFGVGMAFLFAGLVLGRLAGARAARAGAGGVAASAGAAPGGAATADVALEAMRRIRDGVGALRDEFAQTPAETFIARADALALVDGLAINENRHAIAARLGAKAFAEMICEYAVGERYFARAWSAVADGYADEARQSLDTAAPAFAAAVRLYEEALKASR